MKRTRVSAAIFGCGVVAAAGFGGPWGGGNHHHPGPRPTVTATPTPTATVTTPAPTPTATGTAPAGPGPAAGKTLLATFSPDTLTSTAWANPSNHPGNCGTTASGAKKVTDSGLTYAQIKTSGATGDCRSIQSPTASMPTGPGYVYEALVKFSSFHDWPAYWMYGPNWPNQGEIDAVEGGPGISSVTWHQAGNHTIGPDAWDDQRVPFAPGGSNIAPGVWTTVDISFTSTGVDVYYQGKLYVHIPESVTTGGADPMFLTISEGSCNAEGANVCNGGTSPQGEVDVQWVKQYH
jgi:hypothetical protein